MKKRLSIACAIATLSLLVAAPAFADETPPTRAGGTSTSTSDRGYGYTFEDDPLASGVSGTTGFVINIRPKGLRQGLLRPRTSFVPELLKSVEAL